MQCGWLKRSAARRTFLCGRGKQLTHGPWRPSAASSPARSRTRRIGWTILRRCSRLGRFDEVGEELREGLEELVLEFLRQRRRHRVSDFVEQLDAGIDLLL